MYIMYFRTIMCVNNKLRYYLNNISNIDDIYMFINI